VRGLQEMTAKVSFVSEIPCPVQITQQRQCHERLAEPPRGVTRPYFQRGDLTALSLRHRKVHNV